MLAELAAANAAFSIIKQAVSNGRDLANAGSAIADFVGAKEELRKKGEKKKRSPFSGGGDLEEFMALEKIKEQEEQLREMMVWAGRPGMWADWQKFQTEARKARQKAEEARARRKKKIIEVTLLTLLGIVGLGVLGFIVWFVYLGASGKL
jgi:molecular chaperone GrpE (heat shock protein)